MKMVPMIAALLACGALGWAQDDEIAKLKKTVADLETAVKQAHTTNEELAQRLETLSEETKKLRAALEDSDKHIETKTRELLSLRELAKRLEDENRELKETIKKPDTANEFENPNGPDAPIKGSVLAVRPDYDFILLDIGEKDGVKAGYRFDITRAGKTIAVGEVDKFVGTENRQSKLKIVTGDIKDIRSGDDAVARRKIVFKKNGTPEKVDRKSAKINGVIGNGTYSISAGREQGLKPGDKVYVYRDKKVIGVIRLEWVDPSPAGCTSVGKIVEGTKIAEINMDDGVEFEAIGLKKQIIGQVSMNAEKGLIVDVGTNHGAKAGQTYEVRRKGRAVGQIKLTKVYDIYSYADPCEGTTKDMIQKEDTIDLLQE